MNKLKSNFPHDRKCLQISKYCPGTDLLITFFRESLNGKIITYVQTS